MTERDPADAARLRALGSRLRAARGAMTQAALAEATSINQSTLSKYERGESEPGVLSLASIAEVCRVSLEWIATGAGEGPATSSTGSEAAA